MNRMKHHATQVLPWQRKSLKILVVDQVELPPETEAGPSYQGGPSNILYQLPTPASNTPEFHLLYLNTHFQRVLPMSMDTAIEGIVSTVVERTASIATQTTMEVVLKEYFTESDENFIHKVNIILLYHMEGCMLVFGVAGNLSYITCKEPLRNSISTELRNSVQGLYVASEFLELAMQRVIDDNLEFGCATIEKAATEKGLIVLKKELSQQLLVRRKHREASRPATFDPNLIAQGNIGPQQQVYKLPAPASNTPQFHLLYLHTHFQRVLPMAMGKAIQGIVSTIVERTVLKEYITEPDENFIHVESCMLVVCLAGNLSYITCKEPLRILMSTELRNTKQGLNVASEFLGLAMQRVIDDNLEFGCALIEKAATEKGLIMLKKELSQELSIRRKHREASRPAKFDPVLIAQGNIGPQQQVYKNSNQHWNTDTVTGNIANELGVHEPSDSKCFTSKVIKPSFTTGSALDKILILLEVLFKNLDVDMKAVTLTALLKDRVRIIKGNPNFSQQRIVKEDYSIMKSAVNLVELPPEAAAGPYHGGPSHLLQLPAPASNTPEFRLFYLNTHFQRVFPITVDKAIEGIVSIIVERTVSIATQTTIELCLKEYITEPDENFIHSTSCMLVVCRAGNSSYIMCKEPLMSTELRNTVQD